MGIELVRFTKVNFNYPGLPSLLTQFDFKLCHGDYYYLTGKSGIGKTSLLKLIYADLLPQTGSVNVFGIDTRKLSNDELMLLRQNIGIIFQDNRLLPNLPIIENVALPLKIQGESLELACKRAKDLIDWIGLFGAYHKKPHELSDGQKKRVCIARSIITKPLLILADEPTGNLDAENAYRIMVLLEAINRNGTPIICVTHQKNVLEWFPHKELTIDHGSVLYDQSFMKKAS